MKCKHKNCNGNLVKDTEVYGEIYLCDKCEQSYDLKYNPLCVSCGIDLKTEEFEGMQCSDCAMHEKNLDESYEDLEIEDFLI